MRRHTQLLTRGILALIFAAVAVVPTVGSASASELHIVQPGETLSQIAKQYQTTVADLQQRNGLTDANSIRSGQRLLIDAGETVALEPQSVERFQLYTVQPGDTLFLLAGKHGISLARLMAINGFSSEEWLSVGQELLVPRALAPAPQLSHPVSALQPFPPIAGMQPGRTRPAVHTVQPGERLSDIAQRYGVNPAALARLNDLHNNSAPEPGRALRIPSANALELLEGMNRRFDRARYPTRTGRWVEVDLNQQMAIAYEGATPVKAFVISSGVSDTPTVTGTFRIWSKVAMQDMRGGNRSAGTYYHLKDVKNVQYFYKNYAFHGVYWHSNFGTPMSRGCINMTDEDARWLFDWASPSLHDDDDGRTYSTDANPGTLVLVHER